MENKIHEILEIQALNIQNLPLSFIHYKGFMPAAYSYDLLYSLFTTKILCLQPKIMPMT